MMIRREPSIIFEDNHILVCKKEAGVAVQSAGIGKMDLESMLKIHLARKNPGKMPYLAIIQRLDQPVEGVLVFGKTPEAAAKLNKQLTQGKIKKEYLAVVEGIVREKCGKLEHFLKKDGKTNVSSVVSKTTPGGKKACLEYELLEEQDGNSLLKIQLHTGRHHQIRVQLSASGYPLLGDGKYGSCCGKQGGAIGLCAWKTGFFHPDSGKWMEFESEPTGEYFQVFF